MRNRRLERWNLSCSHRQSRRFAADKQEAVGDERSRWPERGRRSAGDLRYVRASKDAVSMTVLRVTIPSDAEIAGCANSPSTYLL